MTYGKNIQYLINFAIRQLHSKNSLDYSFSYGSCVIDLYWGFTKLCFSIENVTPLSKDALTTITRPVNRSEHSHMLRMHVVKFNLFFDL